ncbi:hypothetical protein RRSWK_00932 [Rhodopirellula sp. SWK7]|nr:hypothetical protein RRSWK_00932 [Rhodopirellula sp. SWK7]
MRCRSRTQPRITFCACASMLATDDDGAGMAHEERKHVTNQQSNI